MFLLSRELRAPQRVWVAGPALRAMTGEAARAYPDETGGMLLGYLSTAPRCEAVVELVIGAGPKAKHGPTRLVPDGRWQQRQLEGIYLSHPTATYLGDWHSHPAGAGQPSHRDLRTAQAIARRRRARAPNPLMAIVRIGDDRSWALAVYVYENGSLQPREHALFSDS